MDPRTPHDVHDPRTQERGASWGPAPIAVGGQTGPEGRAGGLPYDRPGRRAPGPGIQRLRAIHVAYDADRDGALNFSELCLLVCCAMEWGSLLWRSDEESKLCKELAAVILIKKKKKHPRVIVHTHTKKKNSVTAESMLYVDSTGFIYNII